jgi:cysteinyl-tRNA synthetase
MSRNIEPVVPITPGTVSLYTCGPTVYNFAHIGNLKTYLFQDLMKRTFITAGYKVRHCMNITDIDDKIIRDSQINVSIDANNKERHDAMQSLTSHYTEIFMQDFAALNILSPTYTPKATDYIQSMIRLIQKLEDLGLAYVRNGNVYCRIAKCSNYGQLARLDKKNINIGASINSDEYERDFIHDFAIWKSVKPGEPWWDSPWGHGRPGWHIECSAMGIELLGEHIDIHSGGVDLIFPHHENEIAQSEGYLGHTWVKYWVHSEFLLVNGEKMSKSLGNFYTLSDLKNNGFDPKTFRYSIQSNSYRKILNFSFESLHASERALKRIRSFRKRMEEVVATANKSCDLKKSINIYERVHEAREGFWSAMCNDLNTPEAMAHIFTIISDINAQDDKNTLTRKERDHVLEFLDETNTIFACWPQEKTTVDTNILSLIEQRKVAKMARNWIKADQIREQLITMGILLEDHKDGSVSWHSIK